jgi:hypothetical protein
MSAREISPMNGKETGHEAKNATTIYSKTVLTTRRKGTVGQAG